MFDSLFHVFCSDSEKEETPQKKSATEETSLESMDISAEQVRELLAHNDCIKAPELGMGERPVSGSRCRH